MKSIGAKATMIGIVTNFCLFLIKLYIGISSNSLSIYCDAVNNMGDTVGCIIAFAGFLAINRLDETKSNRAQSLCTFVINLIIAVCGAYFIYNGLERIMYPLPVSYSVKYAVVISATVLVKIVLGVTYIFLNKKENSTVLRAMILDSFLDCFITIAALMGLFLIPKIDFAADGIFSVIAGAMVFIFSAKGIAGEVKYLING